MSKKIVSSLMLLLLVVSMFVVVSKIQSAIADVDWWPTFQKDLSRIGYSTSSAPSSANLVWQASEPEIHSGSYAGVATCNGKVIATDGSSVVLIDETAGTLLWKRDFSGCGGFLGTPSTDGNLIYVVSAGTSSVPSVLYALSFADLHVVWSQNIGAGNNWNAQSPAISPSRNLVIVGSTYTNGANGPANVWAYNKDNGGLIWSYTMNPGGFFASAAIDEANGKVFIASGWSDYVPGNYMQLYCLDLATGSRLYRYTFLNTQPGSATPTIYNGKVYYPYQPSNDIYVFDENLNPLPKIHVTNFIYQRFGAIAVAYGKIYTGNDCYDASTGTLLWQTSDVPSGYTVSPAIADNKVYMETTSPYGFSCYDANSGARLWNYVPIGQLFGSPAISNGKVYFTTFAQRGLYVFGTPPSTYDVTITAHCDKEGVDPHVQITKDGVPSGHNTPYTFTVPTGAHQFTLPSTDQNDHPFKNWETGQTTPTIIVSGAGTYTAHYVFHNIILYECYPEKTVASLNDYVPIDIGVKNDGSELENSVNVEIWISGVQGSTRIFTLVVSNLQPGESRIFAGLNSVYWWTKGYKEGTYTPKAYAEPVAGETQTSDNTKISSKTVTLENRCGFAIIVEGGPADVPGSQGSFDYDVNTVHNTLIKVNFTEDRINLLRYPTSSGAVRSAIETWAMTRVNKFQPLLLYVVAHGGYTLLGNEVFLLTGTTFDLGDCVSSSDLQSWLHDIRTKTGAPIHVVLEPCHSGSFVDNLSADDNLTIAACKDDEESWSYIDTSGTIYWDFSTSFFGEIYQGIPVNRAFERACSDVATWAAGWHQKHPEDPAYTQTPLLDDNHDGVGDTGRLPRAVGGEGWYANGLYIGNCEWLFPWTSATAAAQCYAWPPPAGVTLWAKVENDTGVRCVLAMMIPPDYSLSNETEIISLPSFEMFDNGSDGNYTVTIPTANFTDHASEPSSFRFVILAQQEDGMTSFPSFSDVVFTVDGQPPPDTNPPTLFVTRPLGDDMVHGTIMINGTTADDVSLQKIELYRDSTLLQTIDLPRTSESFFQFTFDTTILTNGPHNFLVKCYDSSNNVVNQTLTLYVINNVHDIAVVNADLKSVVFKGFNMTASVTIANHGSYVESTNVTFYLNSTMIETNTVTNLSVDGIKTTTFSWNTTGFALANYTISVYAELVPGEINTGDNNFSGGWVIVSVVGDITGPTGWPDGLCDMRDIGLVARNFGLSVPPAPANCDITGPTTGVPDGKIDMRDIGTVARHFGEHYP